MGSRPSTGSRLKQFVQLQVICNSVVLTSTIITSQAAVIKDFSENVLGLSPSAVAMVSPVHSHYYYHRYRLYYYTWR